MAITHAQELWPRCERAETLYCPETMRWFSKNGEFAFLSVGSTANGVIAVGGVATGVVAIGGILAVGAVSIGMNAVGSVAAFGMNAVAPISIALINGFGLLTLAGINGWGAFTLAGVNATGATSRGGINSDHSVVPAIAVIVLLVVISSYVRGRRAPRNERWLGTVPLLSFLRSTETGEQRVRARLREVREDAIELAADDESLTVTVVDAPALAIARTIASSEAETRVIARVSRTEEIEAPIDPGGYRARPRTTTHTVVRCLDVARDEASESWLPKDAEEVKWALAWSARVSALVSFAVVAWLLR